MLLMSGSAAMAPTAAMAQTVLPGFVIDTQGQNQAGSATRAATAEGAAGPDTTIVAERSAVGSKTDTPVLDIPAAVSVVTEVEMEKRGVVDVQQAVSYTSSVAVDVYGSDDRYDSFLIRGFEVNSNGTYRDGLALRFPGWTGVRMEPYGLQRLEVLKGSTSTLFGLNGPGGLINGVTKRPQEADFGEAYTTIGEDHIEAGTDFGGRINDDWSYRITTKGQDGTHGRDFSEDDRIYIAPALTWRPTDATTLTFLADYHKRDSNAGYAIPAGVDVDPGTFYGEPDFDAFNIEEKNIGYLFEHKFGGGLTFRQNARYSDITLDYKQVYPGALNPETGLLDRYAFSVDGESQRFAIDTQLQYDARWDNLETRTLVGVDYLYYTAPENILFGLAPGVNPYDPGFTGADGITLFPWRNWRPDQQATGIYVQEELTFNQRWILTLGGRYDHVRSTAEDLNSADPADDDDTIDKAFTKKIGLTYKATDEVSVYGNYSESFLPLAYPVFNGTSGLAEPQEGTQYEVGVKYRPRGLNALFTVALFDLTQTNVPETVSVTGERRQVGEVNVRGIELEGKIAMYENWNLTMAYSYWNAEIVQDGIALNEGNRPAYVPEHLASVWVDYTFPANEMFGALTLGVGMRFVGSTFGNTANTFAVDSHTLVDAGINYKISDDWSLAVNATNIFDEEYIATSLGDTVYYGDGRTVKATLKHTW